MIEAMNTNSIVERRVCVWEWGLKIQKPFLPSNLRPTRERGDSHAYEFLKSPSMMLLLTDSLEETKIFLPAFYILKHSINSQIWMKRGLKLDQFWVPFLQLEIRMRNAKWQLEALFMMTCLKREVKNILLSPILKIKIIFHLFVLSFYVCLEFNPKKHCDCFGCLRCNISLMIFLQM